MDTGHRPPPWPAGNEAGQAGIYFLAGRTPSSRPQPSWPCKARPDGQNAHGAVSLRRYVTNPMPACGLLCRAVVGVMGDGHPLCNACRPLDGCLCAAQGASGIPICCGTPLHSRCTAAAGDLRPNQFNPLLQTAYVYSYIQHTSCIRRGEVPALGFAQPLYDLPSPRSVVGCHIQLRILARTQRPTWGVANGVVQAITDGGMGAPEEACIGCIQAGKRPCQPPASNFPTTERPGHGSQEGQALSRARAGAQPFVVAMVGLVVLRAPKRALLYRAAVE